MAKNKITGITIEINGDTTKLDQALKKVNKTSKSLKQELKYIDNALKFNPGNSDLIAQKQRVLAESVKNTKEKLDLLKQAQEEAKKALASGDIGQSEYDELTRKVIIAENQLKNFNKELDIVNSTGRKVGKTLEDIGKKGEKVGSALSKRVTAPLAAIGAGAIAAFNEVDEGLDIIVTKTGASGEALEDLEGAFEDVYGSVPATSEEAGSAVGELNTQFGLTGEALADASANMIKYSKITGDDVTQATINAKEAIEKYGLSAEDLPHVLDAVAKAGQDTGVSTGRLFDILIKGSPQLKEIAMDFDEAVVMMSRLEQKGFDTSKALSYLTKAQTQWAKEGITVSEGLQILQEELGKAETDVEKLEIASNNFGTKGGAFMLEALETGALYAWEFEDAVEGIDGTVENTFEGMKDPIDEWTVLMNNLKLTLSGIGVSLQEALAPFVEKLIQHLKNLKTTWDSLSPAMQEMIVKIGLIAGALGPVIFLVSKFAGALGSLITFFSAGGAGASAFGAIMTKLPMLLSPTTLAITAIVGAGIYLIKHWDDVKAMAAALADWIGEKWENIKNWTAEKWNNVKDTISGAWNGIKTSVADGVTSVGEKVSAKWNELKERTASSWESIKGSIANAWNSTKQNTQSALQTIAGNMLNKWSEMGGTTGEKWEAIKQGIMRPIEQAKDHVRNMIDKMKSFFNFEWQLPKIKLPHFTKVGTGLLGLPKIGVEWYDKGGIFNSPSIIGVGEKRPEFVGALDDLKSIVADVIDSRQQASGVVVTGNTFVVRTDDDIRRIAEELNRLQQRQVRGGLSY